MTSQQNISFYYDDMEDVLKKIEKSFNISFVENELSYVQAFGELCNHIITKIKEQNADDCTSQQAFYN